MVGTSGSNITDTDQEIKRNDYAVQRKIITLVSESEDNIKPAHVKKRLTGKFSSPKAEESEEVIIKT